MSEMKLVIAEKPSVAMALAKVVGARERKDGYVEGKEYLVSWCVGHLVAFCDASEYDERYKKWRYEDLPIIPEEWKRKVLDGTKKQFQILKKLMNSKEVDEVICATDAGREGELIFRLVYEQAGCKKPQEARERIVQLMGDVPRIELFARQKTPGWDVWGNEVESDIEMESRKEERDEVSDC